MATLSAEERLDRAERLIKRLFKKIEALEATDGELWQAIADKDEVRGIEEDEIRAIAERARRSIQRHERDHD